MTAQTTSLVAAIYPVHDRIESWADADMTRALRYIERTKKRFTTKNVSIFFDWKTNTAHTEKNKKKQTVKLKPGAFDPLSIFYFFRMQELREGLELSRPVADRKRCIQGVANVRGRQTVHSNGQQWDTWLVEPDLSQIKHVFEKNPDARLQIWVTADERRIPVKLKSKIAVGSFTAELVRIEPVQAETPALTAVGSANLPLTARFCHVQPPKHLLYILAVGSIMLGASLRGMRMRRTFPDAVVTTQRYWSVSMTIEKKRFCHRRPLRLYFWFINWVYVRFVRPIHAASDSGFSGTTRRCTWFDIRQYAQMEVAVFSVYIFSTCK